MDPVTHGLIGGSVSASIAEQDEIRIAGLAGAAAAMFPDLDILINSASDPLLQLEYHRTITHAISFIPIGALIVAAVFWWFVQNKITFKRLFLYSVLGIATAGLADIFTSYGVQLLWPLADQQFAWNLIAVFDPLFSLGILIGFGYTFYSKNKLSARMGLGWLVIYLLFALVQQHRTVEVTNQIAEERNHQIDELIVKPTIANELLWSIRYVSGDTLYADGVQLLPFSEPKIYKGRAAHILNWKQRFAHFEGTTLYSDVARFSKLSNNILVVHPDKEQVIGDGRYAMLPTSVEPLWGIKIDTTNPNNHVNFKTYRDASPEIRNQFLKMLIGK